MNKTKLGFAVASVLALGASAPTFAAVDPVISEGMVSVQTHITELGAAGMPVLIALGLLGIGIGVVMALLRKGSNAVR